MFCLQTLLRRADKDLPLCLCSDLFCVSVICFICLAAKTDYVESLRERERRELIWELPEITRTWNIQEGTSPGLAPGGGERRELSFGEWVTRGPL